MPLTYFFRRKRLLINWFLSYTLILIVPVLFSGIIYFQSSRIVENEINKVNRSLVDLLQQEIDDKLEDIERVGNQIEFNERVQLVLTVKESFGREHQLNLYRILRDLALVKSANGFVSDSYIFFPSTQTVLSNSSHIEAYMAYDIFSFGEHESYEEWLNFLSQVDQADYYTIYKKYLTGNSRKALAYIKPLRLRQKPLGEPSGVLIQTIELSQFMQIVEDMNWINEGNIYIVDGNNQTLVTTDSSDMPIAHVLDSLPSENSLSFEMIGGEEYTISSVSSQFADWKYVYMLPSRVFLEKVEHIKRLTQYGLIICFLLGGIIAFLFSRKNYNPVNRILETLDKEGLLSFDTKFDEYSFILETLNTTIDENYRINWRLQQQNTALRSNTLSRLLKGRSSEFIMPIEDLLLSYDIEFHSEYFAVALIYIEDFSDFVEQDTQDNLESNLRLVKYTIKNVVEELINNIHQGYVVEIDDMQACIVNFKNTDLGKGEADLLEAIKTARAFLQDNFNIYFSVSVSDVNRKIEGITAAYQQAIDAMECKILIGEKEIIRYRDISSSEKNLNYPLENEQKLINYMKEGNFEKAKMILDELYQNNPSDTVSSLEAMKGVIFGIVLTIQKNIDNSFVVSFMEEFQPYKRLQNCTTIMEMKPVIEQVLEIVCEYGKERSEAEQDPISNKIIEFIEENFADINLNVTMVGEEFNMTAPYISKLFKDQTGEKLLDKINRVRLDKAKQLLTTSQLNIGEIGEKVGYSNSSVFIRTFKKYEGITPGKYKELNSI